MLVNYLSEIWGSHKGNNIEKATSCFLLASVKRSKFNAAVFAE